MVAMEVDDQVSQVHYRSREPGSGTDFPDPPHPIRVRETRRRIKPRLTRAVSSSTSPCPVFFSARCPTLVRVQFQRCSFIQTAGYTANTIKFIRGLHPSDNDFRALLFRGEQMTIFVLLQEPWPKYMCNNARIDFDTCSTVVI